MVGGSRDVLYAHASGVVRYAGGLTGLGKDLKIMNIENCLWIGKVQFGQIRLSGKYIRCVRIHHPA
jgi:hypothetical protein